MTKSVCQADEKALDAALAAAHDRSEIIEILSDREASELAYLKALDAALDRCRDRLADEARLLCKLTEARESYWIQHVDLARRLQAEAQA